MGSLLNVAREWVSAMRKRPSVAFGSFRSRGPLIDPPSQLPGASARRQAVVSMVGRMQISEMFTRRGSDRMKTRVSPTSEGSTAPSLLTCA